MNLFQKVSQTEVNRLDSDMNVALRLQLQIRLLGKAIERDDSKAVLGRLIAIGVMFGIHSRQKRRAIAALLAANPEVVHVQGQFLVYRHLNAMLQDKEIECLSVQDT